MIKIASVILTFFVFAFCGEYSLKALIDSAYKHSHPLAVANIMKEKGAEAIDEAKRNMLPKITFSGDYSFAITTYNSMANMVEWEDMFYGWGDFSTDDLFLFPKNTLSGRIDLQQTFFAQNKLRRAVEYALIQNRGLICNWQDVRMKVKADMTKMYYNALISRQRMLIEEQSKNISESRHNQTLSLFESRMLSEIDTLNSFIDFSQASVRLSEAKRGEREIYRSIAVAAGLKEPADSIFLTDTLLPAATKFDYELLLEHFLSENKDLRMLATEVSLAEVRVKIAKGDYFPIIYGGLSLNRIAQFDKLQKPANFDFAPERKLYLGMTYDVTPFGLRQIRVKQSEYDLKITKRNFEERQEQLTLLLRSNYETIDEEITKMQEGEKMLKASEKALILAQNQYASGLLSQVDMETAEQRFRNSGLNYLLAVFRYNSLLIDLRIMGADYLYEPIENTKNERFDGFNNYYLRGE
ncbi:MAG: TolC family protein [Chitinivibrionia bacterium]|nr:TolC family protein [Chitinivibrionia bacterium]